MGAKPGNEIDRTVEFCNRLIRETDGASNSRLRSENGLAWIEVDCGVADDARLLADGLRVLATRSNEAPTFFPVGRPKRRSTNGL